MELVLRVRGQYTIRPVYEILADVQRRGKLEGKEAKKKKEKKKKKV